MKDKKYGVELTANIESFKRKLLEAKNVTNSVADAIKSRIKEPMEMAGETSKKSFEQRIATIGELSGKYGELVLQYMNVVSLEGRGSDSANKLKEELNRLTKQIEQEGEALGEVADAMDDLVDSEDEAEEKSFNIISIFQNFDRSMRKGVNSIKRFTLSIVGVQSVYSMLSRATHAYMNLNEELGNRMQANWIALGAIMEPIINKLIELFTKLVGYINVFVKAFTGGKVDLIGKALDKVNKKTRQASASTQSLASGLDEITNLDVNKGIGDSDVPSIADYLEEMQNMELNPKIVKIIEDFAKRLKKVWEWVDKNKKDLAILGGIIATAFAIFKVVGFINKLKTIFEIVGVIGGSAGLGLWVAVIGTIMIDIGLAITLFKELENLFEARRQRQEAENRVMDSYNDGLKTIQEQLEKNNKEKEDGLITEEQWRRRNNELMQGAEQNLDGINRKIQSGKNLTREQREELEKQKQTLESLSGKKFETTISANLTWSQQAKNFISDNGDMLWAVVNPGMSLGAWLGKKIRGFAKGNVAYGPTVAEFGEYSNANSNPEITAPQNLMRETLFEALTDALPLIGSQQQQDNREIVLNVNGREFARATYGDYQTEAKRVGSSNVAIRRG